MHDRIANLVARCVLGLFSIGFVAAAIIAAAHIGWRVKLWWREHTGW